MPPARLSLVKDMLAPVLTGVASDLPAYLHCPSAVVFSGLALRSAPAADRALSARQPADYICGHCEEAVAPEAAATRRDSPRR